MKTWKGGANDMRFLLTKNFSLFQFCDLLLSNKLRQVNEVQCVCVL